MRWDPPEMFSPPVPHLGHGEQPVPDPRNIRLGTSNTVPRPSQHIPQLFYPQQDWGSMKEEAGGWENCPGTAHLSQPV